MLKKLKHVGIAVKSIDETMARWSKQFGAVEVRERKTFEPIGQTSTLVQIGDTYIELMEPWGTEESTISKFLANNGEGFHHLSWLTDDVNAEGEHLTETGIKVLGQGQPVIFTHPKSTGGLVFEITEQED